MSKEYYRSKNMFSGEFRCINCKKLMVHNVKGQAYEIELKCPRCKAIINIKCGELVPFSLNHKDILKSSIKSLLEIKWDKEIISTKLQEILKEIEF